MQSANPAISRASWPGVSPAAASESQQSVIHSDSSDTEGSFPETFDRFLNAGRPAPEPEQATVGGNSAGETESQGKAKTASPESSESAVAQVTAPAPTNPNAVPVVAPASGKTGSSETSSSETNAGGGQKASAQPNSTARTVAAPHSQPAAASDGNTSPSPTRTGSEARSIEPTGAQTGRVHQEPRKEAGAGVTEHRTGAFISTGRTNAADSSNSTGVESTRSATAENTPPASVVNQTKAAIETQPREHTMRPPAHAVPVDNGSVGKPTRAATGVANNAPVERPNPIPVSREQGTPAAAAQAQAASRPVAGDSASHLTASERMAATRQESPREEILTRATPVLHAEQRPAEPREPSSGMRGMERLVQETMSRDLQIFWQQRARISRFEGAGTSVAKQSEAVSNASNQNQFAGRPVQNLPGAHGPAARDNFGVTASTNAGSQGAKGHLDRLLNPTGEMVSLMQSGTEKTAGAALEGLSPLSGGNLKVSDQLMLNLTREVMTFRHHKADSMAVVLKPDAGTEIFLHLTMKDGQVEVMARFERGDFAALNAQWEQLQQSLNRQGVRLGSLQDSQQQTGNQSQAGQQGNPGQQSHREQDQPKPFDNALEDLVMSRNSRQLNQRISLRSPAATQTGLEVWA